MWTDGGPARQMRAALRPLLPPRANLKRDRGEALFVSNAPAFEPLKSRLPGFIVERRGPLMAILPDASWLMRLERRHPQPPDALSNQLARFRGMAPNRENLLQFARGVKLLDGGKIPKAELESFDRALRQRAALALRGGCGGGLYAISLLLYSIKQNIEKEEDI